MFCIHAGLCAICMQNPLRPEEGIGASGTGVTDKIAVISWSTKKKKEKASHKLGSISLLPDYGQIVTSCLDLLQL